MRVDKSGFYMHCRLHSLQAAVHFYVIGGAYGGHREGGFSVPPTIFTPPPMSLCRSGMGVCCTCAGEAVQIV